jgi:hypothetical protein
MVLGFLRVFLPFFSSSCSIFPCYRMAGIETGMSLLQHRQQTQPYFPSIDGEAAQRIVLGDWYEQGSVLRVDDAGYDLQVIPL